MSGPARAHIRPCRDIFGKSYYATSGVAGLPSTLQGRESLTGAAIGDPTEDTGTGKEGTETGRTQMDRPMEAAQDAVLEEAFTLVGEDRMETTAEVEVREGVLVTTLTPFPPHPPTKTDIECRVAARTVRMEVGWHKKNGWIRGVGEINFPQQQHS